MLISQTELVVLQRIYKMLKSFDNKHFMGPGVNRWLEGEVQDTLF